MIWMCLKMTFYIGNIAGMCIQVTMSEAGGISGPYGIWSYLKVTSDHGTSTCQSIYDGNCSQTERYAVKSRKLMENVPIWEASWLETPAVVETCLSLGI